MAFGNTNSIININNTGANIPNGGLKGDVLTKRTNEDGDLIWAVVPTELPNNGAENEVLQISSGKPSWKTIQNELPSYAVASVGDVLQIASGNTLIWAEMTPPDYTEVDPTVPAWAKEPTKPTYNYNEIINKPTYAIVATSGDYLDLINKPTIPTEAVDVNAVPSIDGKADPKQTSSPMTSITTSRALLATDSANLLMVSSASEVVLTIPTNATVGFPIGTEIEVVQEGAGKVTFAPASGVTLHSTGEKRSLNAQYGFVGLKKVATDDWRLVGNIS